jgi:hypothetical protein
VWLGALGLALSALCALVALTGGVIIPPEGDLTKAITFDFALGVYLITLGFIAPLAHFKPRARQVWLASAVVLSLYAYALETIPVQQEFGWWSLFNDTEGNRFALVPRGQ